MTANTTLVPLSIN